MKGLYHQLAGTSVERLCALSDGIFAVAMTLLVLDVHVPPKEPIHTEEQLWLALAALSPQLVAYGMSLLTLGIFWVGQQAQLNLLERADRHLTWIHITFLFAVSLMPFSTRLLAEFILFRTALLCYWGNILLLGVTLHFSWRCAQGGKLVRSEVTTVQSKAIERRIFIAQALYAFGALLCLFNTYVSIAFIVSVQLVFAISPRNGPLSRF
jgi:TMEM175 potassium channel family protein